MQFKVNNGAVKMLELIDQSKSLVWKITFPVVIVIMAWNLPDTISAIMPLLKQLKKQNPRQRQTDQGFYQSIEDDN